MPLRLTLSFLNLIFPLVAQLDNAADSDSEERGFESLRAGQKKTSLCGVFFIQSEGSICNRRQAYVIRLPCKRYVIKPSALYVFLFGLITYLSSKGLHTSLRDDYIPSATDYIQGFALIFLYSVDIIFSEVII